MLDYTKMSDTENAIMQGIAQCDTILDKIKYIVDSTEDEETFKSLVFEPGMKILLPDGKITTIYGIIENGEGEEAKMKEINDYLILRTMQAMWTTFALYESIKGPESLSQASDGILRLANEHHSSDNEKKPKEESV